MAVDISKLNVTVLTGPSSGITISKLGIYFLLVPGTEGGGTPPVNQGFTYHQMLRRPE